MSHPRRPSMLLPAVVLATLGGCTNYRYDVVTPDAMSLTVVKDRDLIVPAAPARLRLRQVESRCVVLIENTTADEIVLDGNASAVVDPVGQSRAIATQLIASGSFVKLILPPLRDAPPAGPAFQFGLGVLVDAGPGADLPRQARYLDTGRAQDYWEWSGEGQVRLILSLRQKDQTTRHEIVLRREKNK